MSDTTTTPNRIKALAGVMLAAIGVAATGCGGMNHHRVDSSKSGADTITKQQFVDRADAILCKKSKGVTAAVAAQVATGHDPTPKELAGLIEAKVLPLVHTAYDQLAALPVPAGDDKPVSALLGAMHDTLAKADADPAIVMAQPDPFTHADQLVKHYGIDGCA